MKKGIGISAGIAVGPAFIFAAPQLAARAPAQTLAQERQLFEAALARTEANLADCKAQTEAKAGEKAAEIFEAHLMLLADADSVTNPIRTAITDGKSAVDAVSEHFQRLADTMAELQDDYMRQRAADILDLRGQLLQALQGSTTPAETLPKGCILIARELTPSDTIRLDLDRVAGILCEEGGKTSHAAILARALEIPAIVGCKGILDEVSAGCCVAMDGETGEAVCAPSAEILTEFKARQIFLEKRRAIQREYLGKPTCTQDGAEITLLGNVASAKECAEAVAAGADGIGLFRSEFLYINRDTLPSEEEQFAAYRAALEAAEGRPVTIRTLDAGGDKALLDVNTAEANPFLGYRAIRVCLDRPELFRCQLRALYRASAYGHLNIMFPMISSIEELRRAKALAAEVRIELESSGVSFDKTVPLGMMIEVPAAAVMADCFAKEADFFSIGTNDLVQYTVAVDRTNEKIASLYTYFNPAVLRLIRITIQAADAAGIPCCMCGEAAGDPEMIPLLAGFGLRSFSMSAPAILPAKQQLCGLDTGVWRAIAEKASNLPGAEQIQELLKNREEQ